MAKAVILTALVPFCATSDGLAVAAAAANDAGAGGSAGRRQPPPILTLPKSYRDASDANASFVLKPAKDGSNDLVAETPAFTARVSPDGSVRFEDRPTKLSLIPPWLPPPPPSGTPTLERLLRNKLKALPNTAAASTPQEHHEPASIIPAPSPYHADIKSSECRHPSPCQLALKPLPLNVTGNFDITDELMRLRGRDPHRQERARFLEQTRELRIRLAVQTHAENLRAQMMKLPDLLRAIACDEGRDIVERRAVIESLQSEMDTALEAGRFAVEQIRAFLAHWQRDGEAFCRSPK